MKRLIPDSIATRTLLVLVVGLMVSHLLSMALYFTDRASALAFTGGEHIGERIITVERLIRNSSPAERDRIIKLSDDVRLHVTLSAQSSIKAESADNWQTKVLHDALVRHMKNAEAKDFRLRYATDGGSEAWRMHLRTAHPGQHINEVLMVSFPLQDGSWLNFSAPVERPETFWSMRFILSISVMLLATALLSAIVVMHLGRPLTAFADAAQRLGVDVQAPPMPVTGPAEVRQAAHAFNEMQKRIRRFVEDRTQMIAAISHDLGTPITRLRLRAEFIEEENERRKMLADLDDMERMVSSALSFSRDSAQSEPRTRVDLRSLLQRVHDDAVDAGFPVWLEIGEGSIPYWCRPVALRRALTNLVENAAIYGERAVLSLEHQPEAILIRIDDEGPGIPEDLQEEMFRPFRRLEASRNRRTGGTGLGLTIARSIIRGHGGDMTMHNKDSGGLQVQVRLPG